MRRLKGFCFFFICFFWLSVQGEDVFDVNKASRAFDALTIRLSTEQLQLSQLKLAIEKLEQLDEKAQACVTKNATEVDAINKKIQTLTSSTNQTKNTQFLEEKRQKYEKRQQSCQLFSLRVQEALTSFKKVVGNLKLSSLTQKEIPVWNLFSKEGGALSKPKAAVDVSTTFQAFNQTSGYLTGVAGLFLLALGFFLTFQLKKGNRGEGSFPSIVERYLTPLVFFAGMALFFYLYDDLRFSSLVLFSLHLLVFFILCSLLNFALPLSKHAPHVFPAPVCESRVVFFRFIYFSLAAIFSVWINSLMVYFHALPIVLRIFDLIAVTSVAILFALLGFSVCDLLTRKSKTLFFKGLFKALFFLIALTTIVLEWIGFNGLASFIIKGIYRSVVCFILFYVAIFSLKKLSHNFLHKYPVVAGIFSLRETRVFLELVFLRYVLYLLLIYALVIVFTYIWATEPHTLDKAYTFFSEGFQVSNFSISPLRIVYALLSFSIVSLSGRFVATQISRQYQERGEAGKQVAVATIFVYISYSIALVVSLIVVGVDFTGLAIIAGALSVGIGLGLQNIVNNFVSGIILLIEKPIKPGDRILVGDIEGFVKKVRVRSTQITTLSHEDVIVPNSELITKEVTNFMFRDTHWRVVSKVGVAYGSDTRKVEQVLLLAATEHEKVLTEGAHTPRVLFKEFGDSALVFELWCVINDVNDKYAVVSELNFLIEEKFKQADIIIAFPQRDIHIKQMPTLPT